ncbi:MAG: helix-turn-helix transcriptional regulator [Eubacteriales bacterium]|nr:helix-turn-helix transcriptional regulator [Eubacteriales bacterium]
MDYQALANNIQRFRKSKNLTQDQLAEQIGVSSQAVSKWENGASCPDIALLPELAKIFEVSIDEIFSQPNFEVVTYQQEGMRKNIDEMFFRVRILSSDGDKVNVNLPMALLRVMPAESMGINIGGVNLSDSIDFKMIMDLAEKGAMGKLVEIESADGDHIQVFVD